MLWLVLGLSDWKHLKIFFVKDHRFCLLGEFPIEDIFPSFYLYNDFVRFVPESARWLVSLKRYEEADVILRRAARFNKKTMPENWWDQLDSVHEKNDKPQNKSATYGYFDLIKTPVVRKRTLTCFFLWPVS